MVKIYYFYSEPDYYMIYSWLLLYIFGWYYTYDWPLLHFMGNVIFMVDKYIHGVIATPDWNGRLKGLMGMKGLNAGGCPFRLLYRPSVWFPTLSRVYPEKTSWDNFFLSFHKII